MCLGSWATVSAYDWPKNDKKLGKTLSGVVTSLVAFAAMTKVGNRLKEKVLVRGSFLGG